MTLSDFLIGVGQLKFRGTSVLFRFNKSIGELINSFNATQSILEDNQEVNITNGLASQSLFYRPEKKLKSEKQNSSEALYELATHSVRVKRTGTVGDISALWDLEGATTPNILFSKGFSISFFFVYPSRFLNFLKNNTKITIFRLVIIKSLYLVEFNQLTFLIK